jgi:hypothetical protein
MFINLYIFQYPRRRNKPEIFLHLVAAAAYLDSEQEVGDVAAYILVLLQKLWRDPLLLACSSESQFPSEHTASYTGVWTYS